MDCAAFAAKTVKSHATWRLQGHTSGSPESTVLADLSVDWSVRVSVRSLPITPMRVRPNVGDCQPLPITGLWILEILLSRQTPTTIKSILGFGNSASTQHLPKALVDIAFCLNLGHSAAAPGARNFPHSKRCVFPGAAAAASHTQGPHVDLQMNGWMQCAFSVLVCLPATSTQDLSSTFAALVGS